MKALWYKIGNTATNNYEEAQRLSEESREPIIREYRDVVEVVNTNNYHLKYRQALKSGKLKSYRIGKGDK